MDHRSIPDLGPCPNVAESLDRHELIVGTRGSEAAASGTTPPDRKAKQPPRWRRAAAGSTDTRART